MNTTVEVLTPENRLAQIAQRSGLTQEAAHQIAQTFVPFVADAGAIAREAEGVVVTSVEQKAEIKKSQELRKRIGKVRIGVENHRKVLKEDSLRRGKLIDDLSNHVKGLIEPHETRLHEQEKIAERQEAERLAKIKAQRLAALGPYVSAILMPSDITALSDAEFAQLLQTQKDADEFRRQREAREAEERRRQEEARQDELREARAEAARLLDEKNKADEQARIAAAKARAEQERLQAEKDAIERKAHRESEELKAKMFADQAKREAEQREIDAKAREERRVADEKAAQARRLLEESAADMLTLLRECERALLRLAGEPPVDEERWSDDHGLINNVRCMVARVGGGR